MSSSTNTFFEEKRQWSKIKDQVLEKYMPVYLAKVNTLTPRRSILLIDGYAGPGEFDDHTKGSPYIICSAAEKYAKSNYRAFFINKSLRYHQRLEKVIQENNWTATARAVRADSLSWLQNFSQTLTNQTVFLYLDPFGPTGCSFEALKPFLTRGKAYSTEILLTMNMPGIPRLAAPHAVAAGRQEEKWLQKNHQRLSEIFGGDYWRESSLRLDLSDEERGRCLIEAYIKKLAQYLPFTGSCPVRARVDKRVKYYIVFASRHPDAMLLMNNYMIEAYGSHMHKASYDGTLFENLNWREMRDINNLAQIILDTVQRYPGKTRAFIWLQIVRAYFMQYLESEYKDIIQQLVDERRLICPTPRKTKRLNDDCALYLP